MRRNSYSNPYMPSNDDYISTFVAPLDLGLVYQANQESQKRYDASNQAMAESRNALYNEAFYDPEEKKRIIDEVEGRFENLYKNYSGDLSSATGDMMHLIGGIRKNPAFALNAIALQKQKEQEAMKRQYGAKYLEFTPLPKGLRDEQGNLRKQEDFNFDAVQDLERQEKAASIWEQALEQVSREGGLRLSKDGKFYESTKVSSKGGFGQVDNKLDAVYKEFMGTAEGKLHERILREKMGVKDTEKEIKSWLKGLGDSRVAPESYDVSRIQNPDYRRGSVSSGNDSEDVNYNFDFALSPVTQSKETNSGNTMPTVNDIIKKAQSKEETPDVLEARNKVINAIEKSSKPNLNGSIDHGIKTDLGLIRVAMGRLGVNPDDYIKNGIVTNPFTKDDPLEETSNYYGFDKLVTWIPGAAKATAAGVTGSVSGGSKPTPTQTKKLPEIKTQEDKQNLQILNEYINNYNKKIRENLKGEVTGDYNNFKYYRYNPRTSDNPKKQRDIELQQKLLTESVLNVDPTQFIIESGPLSFINTKSPDKYTKEEREMVNAFRNTATNVVSAGWGEKRDLKFEVITPQGINIIRPKSLDVANAIAGKSDKLRQAAFNDFINIPDNSSKIFVRQEGIEVPFELKDGLKFKHVGSGHYQATRNGSSVTADEYSKQLAEDAFESYVNSGVSEEIAKDQSNKVMNAYLDAIKNHYGTASLSEAKFKPAIFKNKFDLVNYFKIFSK